MNKEQKEKLTEKILKSIEDGEMTLEEARETVSEVLNKAVTSDAAPAENGPENDAELNAENKPSIQDAKSPSEAQQEIEISQQQVPENVDANQAQGGEVSFGNFFKDEPYTIGSTLQQDASGNIIANTKKPGIDYVERAKNHKNQSMTPKDFEESKNEDVEKSNLKKKKGVPEGVDSAKHERCVQQVKEQGHDKESAIKICNESLSKSMSVDEAVSMIMSDKYEVKDVMNKLSSDEKKEKVLQKLREKDKNKAEKAGRCWEGYKPVKGKEPYSEDSCVKKAEHYNKYDYDKDGKLDAHEKHHKKLAREHKKMKKK